MKTKNPIVLTPEQELALEKAFCEYLINVFDLHRKTQEDIIKLLKESINNQVKELAKELAQIIVNPIIQGMKK